MVLMLALFSATKAVSYSIGVSVSSIKIIKESNIIYLDLDKKETYEIDYAVLPTNAENKTVSTATAKYGTAELAEFDFTENGEGSIIVTPKSAGAAKVTLTTADGGFSDSITIIVESRILKSIECTIDNSDLKVGQTAEIATKFSPERPGNTILHYESSDSNIAKVDSRGIVTALSIGEAFITVTADADPNIKQTIKVTVSNSDILDIAYPELSVWNAEGSFPLSINLPKQSYSLNCEVFDLAGNVRDDIITYSIDESGSSPIFNYEFINKNYLGTAIVKITVSTPEGLSVTKECKIDRIKELKASFNKPSYAVSVNTEFNNLFVSLTPSDANVTYEASVSNDLISVISSENLRFSTGDKLGVSTITVKVTSVEHPEQSVTISTDVLVTPTSIQILYPEFYADGIDKDTGEPIQINRTSIEEIVTIGKYDSFDYSTQTGVLYNHVLDYSFNGKENFSNLGQFIKWESSDPANVSIDENGLIKFNNDTFNGKVDFTVKFAWGSAYLSCTSPVTIRCVANGVNVDSYTELVSVTQAKTHAVVLMDDIIDDFGKKENGELIKDEEIKKVDTTYDKDFYLNKGKKNEAKVKVLIEFDKNVYGNGFIINSDNITNGTYKDTETKLDVRYFQGPLDFVAASTKEDNNVNIASVKGQDNISFAVYEGVTLNGVDLQSYNFDSTTGEVSEYDLKELTTVGTTVEIFGNANIEYSRISNGRTVLRIFGYPDNPTKAQPDEPSINVNIQNSVLTRARDFIIRMGSNYFVQDDVYLEGDNATAKNYNNKLIYNQNDKITEEQRKYHDDNFIKTFVTVKDSVFKDAGIFAIGIDSHFSGGLLKNGGSSSTFEQYLYGWEDLAKTSYGAKLTLVGDVRLYNWNILSNIKSDTLIEIPDAFKTDFAWLILDVPAMINKAAENPVNSNILYYETDKDGNQVYILLDKDGNVVNEEDKAVEKIPAIYVHAGIAFFGGGKNYGIVDMRSYNSPIHIDLNGYTISLTEVRPDPPDLTMAAGPEPFYFLLANKNGQFTPIVQRDLLNDPNEAFACIKPKS